MRQMDREINLRTLKEVSIPTNEDMIPDLMAYYHAIKQEAIKHYKYYFYMALNCKEEEKLFAQFCLGQCSFIREFFNLTEEDLKSWKK